MDFIGFPCQNLLGAAPCLPQSALSLDESATTEASRMWHGPGNAQLPLQNSVAEPVFGALFS